MIYKGIIIKADPFSYNLEFDDRITLIGGDSGTGKTFLYEMMKNIRLTDKYNPIKRDKFLIVKSDYKYVRIPFDKILFVESLKDYILFHLEGMENVSTLGNLKHLEERLPKEKFRRIHRSYLANMTKFDVIERGKLIYGSLGIPISDTFSDVVKTYIDEHSV